MTSVTLVGVSENARTTVLQSKLWERGAIINTFIETIPKSETIYLYLPFNKKILDIIGRYINRGYIILTTLNECMEIYEISEKYEMLHLKQLCREDMIQKMELKNVCSIYQFASCRKDSLIELRCWEKFDSPGGEIFKCSDFLRCHDFIIDRFVNREIYENLSEFTLFRGVYNWVKAKVSRTIPLETDRIIINQACRKTMEKFLLKIRFLTMDEDELKSKVFRMDLLTQREKDSINSYISGISGLENFPDTISQCTDKRDATRYEYLFEYLHKHKFYVKKEFTMTFETRFECEILVKAICFVTKIHLPIKHSNEGGISLFVSGCVDYESNRIPDQELVCDRDGKACLKEPVLLFKNSKCRLLIRIPDEDIRDNLFKISSKANYFFFHDKMNDYLFSRKCLHAERTDRLYFNVSLYF
ncbi:uncharacterized protein LOC111631305 [Centruroides sculpturatus]|uniref:uncharacterized protein LOC111631305 n=1 Tax=Centruroides sculpturatus TaxID=218467 RepID=UPI000C6D75FE|nr:uncharacterized protein LOC111631305 [Centruroides sculpturatus]